MIAVRRIVSFQYHLACQSDARRLYGWLLLAAARATQMQARDDQSPAGSLLYICFMSAIPAFLPGNCRSPIRI